jgi:hypothetical protein
VGLIQRTEAPKRLDLLIECRFKRWPPQWTTSGQHVSAVLCRSTWQAFGPAGRTLPGGSWKRRPEEKARSHEVAQVLRERDWSFISQQPAPATHCTHWDCVSHTLPYSCLGENGLIRIKPNMVTIFSGPGRENALRLVKNSMAPPSDPFREGLVVSS